jgi:hypothetical protein
MTGKRQHIAARPVRCGCAFDFTTQQWEQVMSKSVFMQLQMEAGLRASFQEAAERQHRPAAQVLRQLMREYVATQSDAEAVAAGRRLEAARRAAASVALDVPAVGEAPLEEAPGVSSGDRDLEEMARRQQGWGCCPFGVG